MSKEFQDLFQPSIVSDRHGVLTELKMNISKQATDPHHHHHHKDETDECSQSSTKEAVVVEDLILKILLCLPLVSVLRFKCVSKLWYSLISDPCFLRNHARQSHLGRDRLDPLMLSAGLLFCPGEPHTLPTEYSEYAILPRDQDHDTKPLLKTLFDHSLPAFKQKFSSCFLVESCNGLLLYSYENENENLGFELQNQYIVFNPITNQYREVPIMDLLQTFEPEEVEEIYFSELPHIVFDPSISLSYKVIACLYRENPCSNYAFYFYSADTNSWRLLTSFDDEDDCGIDWKTFMFNGVFYWLKHDVSICFDAVKENVWFLPLPPIPSDCSNRDVVYFGECNGRLRLIEEYISLEEDDGWNFPCSFDIMEMDISSKIWTVKYRVNFEEGYDHLIKDKMDPFKCGVVRVLHLYRTNKGEEAILLSVDYEKLVSFNLTTNTFGEEFTIPYIKDYQDLNVYPFTPTLFPLLP